jgi:hypothetical protein
MLLTLIINYITSWNLTLLEKLQLCSYSITSQHFVKPQKVHYHVHKNTPQVSIISQINPVHTTPFHLRSILLLSTHLCLDLPSSLFLSGFLTNILYAFFFFLIRATCPAHPISPSFDHSNYAWQRVMMFLIMQFSVTFCHFTIEQTYRIVQRINEYQG